MTAESNTPYSINLTWTPVDTADLNGNLYLYQVFYKRLDDSVWDNFGTRTTEFTLINLTPGTWYSIRVLASNDLGNGIASSFIKIQTIEGGKIKNPIMTELKMMAVCFSMF